MADPQGIVSFPGIETARGASMTLSHGISPSVCTLSMLPQERLVSEVGTLEFRFGKTRIEFPDCAIKSAKLQISRDGQVWTVPIVDRRWKWEFGEISGLYNRRKNDDELDKDTEKTPQELATLLLDAMGEQGFSVKDMPNKARPAVTWVNENPAGALASLCDLLGCRVVLGLNNRVAVRVVGEGDELPDNGLAMNAGYGVTAGLPPDSIKVVGGPTRFQSKLKLEAVGLDADGSIKPIADLSYKPDGGWSGENPKSFFGVAAGWRPLALQSVFRWYRAVSQADGTQEVPGYGAVNSIKDLLPLGSDLIETAPNAEGVDQSKPAEVEGVFWSVGLNIENTDAGTRYGGNFGIDGPRGIVKFSEPVTKLDDDNSEIAAELYLLASYSVLEDRLPVRYSVDRRLPGDKRGTGPLIVRRDELVRTIRQQYVDSVKPGFRFDNFNDIDGKARAFLDAAEAEHATSVATEVQYAGLIDIEPDGAVQQVSWVVGPQGATTRASRNQEADIFAPNHKERRRKEKLDRGAV